MAIFPITKVPKTIPGLSLWLDANEVSSIIQSGGLVSQWNDLSGNKNNFAQATGGNQPTYNLASLNNKNGVLFNGTSSYMFIPSPVSPRLYPGSGGFTFFLVARHIAGGRVFSLGNNSSTNSGYTINVSSYRMGNGTVQVAVYSYPAVGLSAVPHLGLLTFSGSAANVAIDNVYGTPTSYTGSITVTTQPFVLAATQAFSAFGHCEMFEWIIYDNLLSNANLEIVALYLSNKWGLSITP